VNRADVEVFPIAPDRWIAVIETPGGPFSTEAPDPLRVEAETREAVAHVLGWNQFELTLVDDLGDPWSPEAAEAQAVRLLAP
jgi:hypothetical protein